jgi:Glycosyltransferase like family 2
MAPSPPSAEPVLTVIVCAREAHAHAEMSLRSVLAETSAPFDLIYLDIASPPSEARAIQAICAEHGFAVVRYDTPIAPSLARRGVLDRVQTPYVLFIDNDVLVEPGSFAKLVACAEETGAGIVGPLYLVGDEGRSIAIHMAGGTLRRDAQGALCSEWHELLNQPLDAAADLQRRPVDLVEYHCMLVRTALLRDHDLISQDVLFVHEHIDLSLRARELGFATWFEPSARVTYLALPPRRLQDLAFFQWRWSEPGCEASLAAFAARWPVSPDQGFFADVRQFARDRRVAASPRNPSGPRRDLDLTMQAGELAQTRTALREQAALRGYDAGQLRNLESACDFSTLLFDGVYRPDGRPFLNHVIGTASALIRYEMREDVVLAGLLHAAYTHRPDWIAPEEISRVLASGGKTDALVRALPAAKTQLAAGADPGTLTLPEGLALAIEAANEADMLLSGEYRACGRVREISATGQRLLAGVLTYLETPGLAATAAGDAGVGPQGPVLGFSELSSSFRLDARNRRVEPAGSRT